jgi:glycosyltransferase involved in cell wall biosynthesis
MKVLLICGAGIVSGKEIMSLHLLRELKERGHTCYCIMASWGSDDFRERLRALGIAFYNLRLGFISKTLTWSAIRMTLIQFYHLPFLYIKYSKLVRQLQPNIVIHTNFHHAFLLYPIIGHHQNIYWCHEILNTSRFYRWLFKLFEKKIGLFVTVSQAAKRPLEAFVDYRKIKVITNGITVCETPEIKVTERQYLMFAIVGQVSEQKGHELLLRALSEIPRDKFILKIIGSGAKVYEDYLKQLVSKLGLTNNCLWMGFVKGTDKIYEGVDVVIVPSKVSDSYPTTVMEAGMRGIPVIASTSGGLPEMIKEGVNGYLFTSSDKNSLRSAILKITELHDLKALRSSARNLAVAQFSVGSFADAFENNIETVLRNG